jgi:glutathione peroxidase
MRPILRSVKRRLTAICLAATVIALAGCGTESGPSANQAGSTSSAASVVSRDVVLSGRAALIDGRVENLARYRGKVVLVVNTASRCGFTPQFEGLQALYAHKREAGFVILGFPSNDFKQELADGAEIKKFCTLNYGVDFPMFARTKVTGAEANPLFARMAAASREPSWNFTKYLIDRQGRLAQVFDPGVEPDASELTTALDDLLAAT